MDSRIKAVVFDEEAHTYSFEGKALKGVTGTLCTLMHKAFPDTDKVKLATMYGSDVHKEVERYFNNNSNLLSTDGAKTVVSLLNDFCVVHNITDKKVESEVMVSDFIGTASKVDVVLKTKDASYLFDIKTTSTFDRPYCTAQLSVYKKLYESCYSENVKGLFVLGTKSKRIFRIIENIDIAEKILRINKNA